ncbi:MAG: hypothetical protein ABI898_02300 [Sphingomonadales bacterium]
MTNPRNLLAASMVATLSTTAFAETLKAVPATLDPTKAYVLVEYRLMADPYSDLPTSRKSMPLNEGLALARYDAVRRDIRGLGRAQSNPVPANQEAIERFSNRVIAKSDGSRLMLLAVEPDTWVVAGYGNTSFSLGSYAFNLAPGTVTDLGVVEAARDWAQGDRQANGGDLLKMAFLGPFAKRPAIAPIRAAFRPRTASDLPVPTTISSAAVRRVTFVPNAQFGNYLGGLVNRIEGVNATARAGSQTSAPSLRE